MMTLGNMVVKSAKMRKESRGPHFRLDSRYRDDKNWLKNIFIQKMEDERMNSDVRPVKSHIRGT